MTKDQPTNQSTQYGQRTINGFLAMATAALQAAGIDTARLDSELILVNRLGLPREWLLAHDDAEIAEPEWHQLCGDLMRRVNHYPIAYLTGHKEFYGRDFLVTDQVLIPRPESEQIIVALKSLMKQSNRPHSLLDAGTGSGILAITARLEYPELTVTATDISATALEIAELNALRLHAQVRFIKSDLLANLDGQRFDVIIANLPYVDPDWPDLSPELRYEPDTALYANHGGLALIEQLLKQAPAHLNPGGYVILELDRRQQADLQRFAREHHYRVIHAEPFTLTLQLV